MDFMISTRSTLLRITLVIVASTIVYFQYEQRRRPVAPGVPLSIEEQIISAGVGKDEIPSIDAPIFESVSGADQYLDDQGFGLVVEVKGRARFYPYQILVWHEIVNDTLSGVPLLITYSPLSATGMVFEREVNGEVTEFGVSGKLYNNNLLMYDRKTDSLWSQVLKEAIVGEKKGASLTLYPSLSIAWSDFKKKYPGGQVLTRQTGVTRDYTRNPYGDYETSAAVYFPLNHHDARLPMKTLVFGYDGGDAQKAYPLEKIKQTGKISDTVGGKEIEIIWDDELNTVVSITPNVIVQLSYWFSWVATYPKTELYSS